MTSHIAWDIVVRFSVIRITPTSPASPNHHCYLMMGIKDSLKLKIVPNSTEETVRGNNAKILIRRFSLNKNFFVLVRPQKPLSYPGCLKQGEGKADATIIIGEEDFIAMTTGKLQAMQAFMQGKMKIKGEPLLIGFRKFSCTHVY